MKKVGALVALLAMVAALTLSTIASAGGGFDEFGYNNTARVFNGTGSSWCLAGGQGANCLGVYSSDKLVMKWNAKWDACNDVDNFDPGVCTGAWTNNEWNGNVAGGSGAVWHYKIIWVGPADAVGSFWVEGGYRVWGNYEVLMDQGHDPNIGPGHIWFAHATPNGYGGR